MIYEMYDFLSKNCFIKKSIEFLWKFVFMYLLQCLNFILKKYIFFYVFRRILKMSVFLFKNIEFFIFLKVLLKSFE